MIKAADFCSRDLARKGLNVAHLMGDWVYASDGHIGVRVAPAATENPPTEHTTETQLMGTVAEIIEDAKGRVRHWLTIGKLPSIPPCPVCNGNTKYGEVDCRECNGRGFLEFETLFNSYDHNCKSCDGEGKQLAPGVCKKCRGEAVLKTNMSQVGLMLKGIRLDIELLARLRDMKNLVFGIGEGLHSAQYFRFDGGEGVIMPLRMLEGCENMPVEAAEISEIEPPIVTSNTAAPAGKE